MVTELNIESSHPKYLKWRDELLEMNRTETTNRRVQQSKKSAIAKTSKLVRSIRLRTDITEYSDAVMVFEDWLKIEYDNLSDAVIRNRHDLFKYIWNNFDITKIKNWPLETTKECGRNRKKHMENIRSVCEGLSSITGGTFHLSVRVLANAIGLKKSQAQRLLKDAVDEGWIELVEKGIQSPRVRKAAVYRLKM